MTLPARVRAIAAREGAIAPVHAALGSVLEAVEPGRAVVRIPHLPPHRLRGPGVVPVLGDFALSVAITSALPEGLRISTLTLHTAMVGPLPPPGAALMVCADLVGEPRGTAVSRGEARGADGQLVAHLTARVAVLPLTVESPLFPETPDPDAFAALGQDLLHAAPSLANSTGGVQGGVLAAVLGHSIANALPEGASGDLSVTFVRAVPADGARMAVEVAVAHGGRRMFAADARLRGGTGGRIAALATAGCWLDG